MITLYEIEKELINEMQDRKAELLITEDSYDMLSEIIDSYIPGYNYDLVELLLNNLHLGYIEEPEVVYAKNDIFSYISLSIFEYLLPIANKMLEDLREQ